MTKITFFVLFFGSVFAFSQSNFNYSFGIISAFDLLQPKQYESDYEYFTSVYSNGYVLNFGISNKLNYKKIFTRVDFTYNYASQQQTFVFSNAIDLNISHTIKHHVPYCSIDWTMGRDFELKSDKVLQIELGLSSVFTLSVGHNNPTLKNSGSFTSTYSDEQEHWSGEMGVKEYSYEISYYTPGFITPFIKLGMQLPIGQNYISFGVNAKLKRLVYENFIYLTNDSYSAIANSRSQSSSFGIFVNYQFGK